MYSWLLILGQDPALSPLSFSNAQDSFFMDFICVDCNYLLLPVSIIKDQFIVLSSLFVFQRIQSFLVTPETTRYLFCPRLKESKLIIKGSFINLSFQILKQELACTEHVLFQFVNFFHMSSSP